MSSCKVRHCPHFRVRRWRIFQTVNRYTVSMSSFCHYSQFHILRRKESLWWNRVAIMANNEPSKRSGNFETSTIKNKLYVCRGSTQVVMLRLYYWGNPCDNAALSCHSHQFPSSFSVFSSRLLQVPLASTTLVRRRVRAAGADICSSLQGAGLRRGKEHMSFALWLEAVRVGAIYILPLGLHHNDFLTHIR